MVPFKKCATSATLQHPLSVSLSYQVLYGWLPSLSNSLLELNILNLQQKNQKKFSNINNNNNNIVQHLD